MKKDNTIEIIDSVAIKNNDTNYALEYEKTNDIYDDISKLINQSKKMAYRTIDTILLKRNWLIGKRIREEVLKETRKENYGQDIIESLSKRLTKLYGRGFEKTNLYNFVDFYTKYKEFFQSVTGESFLSWTHYVELLKVFSDKARTWYEEEALKGGWSVRTLKRNIESQYYERLASVGNDVPSVEVDNNLEKKINVLEHVRSPLIFEFLGLSENERMHESDLENALISNLQKVLMELGRGYAFVGRQYRIHTDAREYYIDLVFYNYILKCFVLVDLKTKKITHQDVGQMDMYVRMFDELIKSEDDGPTLGIVLCAEGDMDIARYSILKGNEQLFAAKYKLFLPDEITLKAEIENQKRLFLESKKSK